MAYSSESEWNITKTEPSDLKVHATHNQHLFGIQNTPQHTTLVKNLQWAWAVSLIISWPPRNPLFHERRLISK